ncbi:MAG: hypothetical protein GXY68_11780, partial [Chloroflexi bacterium]|nr:hypothetical protein [Chloroflexota bacterium]
MSHRLLATRYMLLGSVLGLALLVALVGCSKGADGGDTGQTQNQPTATSTLAFKVEVPVTDTPTPVVVNGTVMPTETPAPTGTALPTRTPWPTKAPTSAPADDPAMVYVPGGSFTFGSMDKP